MQCQCKVPMQRQCNANVASIHCQCTANALPMHCQFTANASPMQRQCITNAVPMQYQCKANAVPMKCQCSVNAASIQCQCRSKDSQSGNSWYGTSHWDSSTYKRLSVIKKKKQTQTIPRPRPKPTAGVKKLYHTWMMPRVEIYTIISTLTYVVLLLSAVCLSVHHTS